MEASKDAIEAFGEIGITFSPRKFEDIYRITSRDTDSGTYPYNVGFSEYGKSRRDFALVLDDVEIGFYSTKIGRDKASERVVGETGMIHITPSLRRRGLGTLVQLFTHIQVIEEGASEIRAVEGDETGTIGRNIAALGFTKIDVDVYNQPIWKLTLDGERQKAAKLSQLKQQFNTRIRGLSEEDLRFNPAVVDRDNPIRTPVRDVVMQRLQERGCFFKGSVRILYGYDGARLMIYQENFRDRTTCLVDRICVPGQNELMFNNYWGQSFVDEMPRKYPYPTNRGRPLGWEVETPHLYEATEVEQYAERLSNFSQNFFQ